MSLRLKAKEHRCQRCGKAFTSLMRLQHHRAAEHTPRISRDIATARDVPHRLKGKPWRHFCKPGMRR